MDKLHRYQVEAVDFLMDRLYIQNKPGAGLFLDPGLGKTRIALETAKTLSWLGEAKKVLVIAPLRPVYSVWPAEIKKWGFDFSTSIIHGTPNQRVKAMNADADIYLVNPEGVDWLVRQDYVPWDLLIVDESTKFKNWTSKRTKAIRKLAPKIPHRVVLTGTPAPNSLADLFPQAFVLDNGEALGQTITWFRNKWMKRGGYMNYAWSVRNSEAEQSITDAIAPLVLTMKAEDHLDMPQLIHNEIWVDLSESDYTDYKKLERQLFVALDSGDDLVASGAGGAYAMCKGFANGGVYQEEDGVRSTIQIHNAKLEAYCDLIEELQSKPCFTAYEFNHDLARIETRFKNVPAINGATSPKQSEKLVKDWNAGRLQILAAQPQAVSHGMNLQESANDICWFGLTDQPEVYEQFNRRIYRQGVSGQVRIHHILARGTVDEVRMSRLKSKSADQQSLLKSLRAYREKVTGTQTVGI